MSPQKARRQLTGPAARYIKFINRAVPADTEGEGGPQDPPERKSGLRALLGPYKIGLTPTYAISGLWVAGALIEQAPYASVTALGAGAVAIGLTFAPLATIQRRLRTLSSKTGGGRLWIRTTIGAASGWLALAGVAGVDGGTPAILIGAGGLLSLPYVWHNRIRVFVPEIEPEIASEISEVEADPEPQAGRSGPEAIEAPPELLEIEPPVAYTWDSKVICSGGPLARSTIDGWEEGEYGWTTGVWLPEDASILMPTALSKTQHLTQLYRKRLGDVVIERHGDGVEGHLQVSVLTRTAAETTRPWPGPAALCNDSWDPASWDGIIELGPYVDGRGFTGVRLFERGYGVYHTLITGGTGAGKTGVVRTIIASAEHSGLFSTWVYEPEDNRSLTAWTANGKIRRVALTEEDAYRWLLAAEAVMKSNIAHNVNTSWTDEDGETWKGVDWFDPTPERRALLLVMDEAHVPLSNPRIAKIVARIAKMGRKGGVALVLITQTPTQQELGGTFGGPIRDNILMGNIVVLRTKSRSTGMMLSLPFDPFDLPDKFPNGEKTSGIGFTQSPAAPREQVMFRAMHDQTPMRWAKTSPCHRLHPDAEYAAQQIFDNPDLVMGSDGGEAMMFPSLAPLPSLPAMATLATVTPLLGVEVPQHDDSPKLAPAREKVLDFLWRQTRPVMRKEIIDATGVSPAHVQRVCNQLVSEGVVINQAGAYWTAELAKASAVT